MDLKGKIALVLVNDPDFETGEGDFGGKAMTYYGRWTYKYEEAARQGRSRRAGRPRDRAGLVWLGHGEELEHQHDVRRRARRSGAASTPRGGLDPARPRRRSLQAGRARLRNPEEEAQTREFKPVELKDTTFSADYSIDSEVITSHNIVRRIEGSKRPDETVIYSAHWDHLGVGEPDAEGDTIYNGAVDNATGTAALHRNRPRLRRRRQNPSVRSCSSIVTAEEKGLLGSEYYASNPLYPLATTVAVINMDALDPTIEARNFTTSGSARSELLDALIAQGEAADMTYVSDPHPEAGYFFRSDHFPFAKRGVPALSWGSGNDLVVGGKEAGEAAGMDYREKRYHQPADEWDPGWTFAGMVHDLPILYKLGNDLANSSRWPTWAPGSEFLGIREESSAQRK